jgi:DtxR family transcriptional regulator, Mn-dependent transcriptional regulator
MQNTSKEDYLCVIYKHKNEYGLIKPKIIAEELSISNAAVTDMLRKLEKEGLIIYQKYKEIQLTLPGEIYAKNIIRRHRIWEAFLTHILGMPWEKVHDEANRLEHSSSDELIDRMEVMLDFPEYDPHGAPIPGKDGKLPRIKKQVSLDSLKKGDSGEVIRVNDYDERFLIHISDLGIRLNKLIKVIDRRDYDNTLTVSINGRLFDVSEKIAQNIFVGVKKK